MTLIDIPFEQQTSTWNDHVAGVVADGAQGIGLHHTANRLELGSSLGVVDPVDETNALANTHISPVGAVGIVAVVREEQRAKDGALAVAHITNIGSSNMLATHIRTVWRCEAIVSHRLVTHDRCC